MVLKAVITYSGELTVNYSIRSLKDQGVDIAEIVLFDNVSPMRRAFNLALDYGQGADLLLVLAADTMMKDGSLKRLIEWTNEHYLVTCLSDDVFQGVAQGGLFLFNMNLWKPEWRYGVGPTADYDLSVEIENQGFTRHKIEERLTVHHPVWTSFEMWAKLRFSMPKYTVKSNQIIFGRFFERELKKYPWNQVLKIGVALYEKQISDPKSWSLADKDQESLRKEFDALGYELTGKEHYAMEGWEGIADELMWRPPRPDGYLIDRMINA
jgi:hypothetical protein